MKVKDHEDRRGDHKPRDYHPTRDRSRSPMLDAAQRVLPIPLCLVIEAVRDFTHELIPEQLDPPGVITLPRRGNRGINDLLNNRLY